MHKFVIPEFESRIFDQLNKGDEKTPRMWSVHNQSLQQDPTCQKTVLNRQVPQHGTGYIHTPSYLKRTRHQIIYLYILYISPLPQQYHLTVLYQISPSDLLLDGLSVGLSKEVQHGAAKVVRVAVGVPQLVGNGIQEKVAPCTGENMSSITT